MGKKLKLFVACHKPAEVFTNDVFTPIHIGRAVSGSTDQMNDMIGDDTGDNISAKGASYSEMTAHYWIWKNFHDADYVGVCQYRRYFDTKLNDDNIESYIKGEKDVILIGPQLCGHNRINKLHRYVCAEDVVILYKVIEKIYPEYLPAFSKYSLGFSDYPYNMCICSKKSFDAYCKWMFDILFECEKYIKPSVYSRARRVYGYLAEFLTPLYFIANNYNIKGMQYLRVDENQYKPSTRDMAISNFMNKCIYPLVKNRKFQLDPAVLLGLKVDGIDL